MYWGDMEYLVGIFTISFFFTKEHSSIYLDEIDWGRHGIFVKNNIIFNIIYI